MESIEVIVRQSLNTTAIKENTPDTNVKAKIMETALGCDCQSIPAKYERYSVELLKAVVDL